MKQHTPNRYRWTWKGVSFDFYRLCEILGLKSQPQIHAIKKLIRAGQSIKSTTQDIDEAIAALERWKEMIEEDETEGAQPVELEGGPTNSKAREARAQRSHALRLEDNRPAKH